MACALSASSGRSRPWRPEHVQHLPQPGDHPDLGQRPPYRSLRQGHPGNLGRAHLLLHGRPADHVLLQAGPVRHPGAGNRRPAGDAFLHHLQFAIGALQLLGDHQARAGRQGFQLPARHPARGPGTGGARAGRAVQRHRLPQPEGPIPQRRRRHHPGDVHGPLVLRHQRQRRYGLRAQRALAEGHHLPPRAGAHGVADSQLQPAHHLRETWPRRALGRLSRLPEPQAAGTDGAGLHGARDLLLRPDALYDRGQAPARSRRLRHEPLSRGVLRCDAAGGQGRRGGACRAGSGSGRGNHRQRYAPGGVHRHRQEQPNRARRDRACRCGQGRPDDSQGLRHGYLRHLQGAQAGWRSRDGAQRRDHRRGRRRRLHPVLLQRAEG
ncbi:hypothetical protein COLO4_01175 [Corchorus olitorius]|uniref:Uncharacterized protein n=1 Tax=Corchorus olitorius TaxID=93759 RepID=A0A1R3L2V4_9ROSI|nr:hypothetical protein COLO4_01175 [Corchorus olitorius]